MPDRYADAVRFRRAELRGQRLLLIGGHRAELRGALALTRLSVSRWAAAELAALGREARRHADLTDRAGRRALPSGVVRAVDTLARRAVEDWEAAALPAVRRIAAERRLDFGWGLPRTTGSGDISRVSDGLPPVEPPEGVVRALLTGPGWWRLVFLPAACLPAAGGADLPGAFTLGVLLLVGMVWTGRVAAERARLRQWAAEAVSAARAALDAELGSRLIELERAAGAALDAAVARRRAAVEAELRLLAADEGRVDAG